MRDPTESKDILPSISWDDDDDDRAKAEIRTHLRAPRDRMRVLSFTHDAEAHGGRPEFDCCWSRPRMWEQYGGNHRGACLLFDRASLVRAIHDMWPRERTYLRNVDYTREGAASANLTRFAQRHFEGLGLAQAAAEYVEQRHAAFFFLKSDDFATEYEYRIVLAARDDDYAFIDYRDALVAVVLGERFPVWQRSAASMACSKLGLKLGQMQWINGRPQVQKVW
jgi:hypothetical protein